MRFLASIVIACGPSIAVGGEDAATRIAAELERWRSFARETMSFDPLWASVKSGSAPGLERAAAALRDGHPWLALQRLEGARLNLAGFDFAQRSGPAAATEAPAFEVEWRRVGVELARTLGEERADTCAGLHPAALRALAEVATHAAHALHKAGLPYSESSDLGSGLFYVGQAQAASSFVTWCRTLASATGPPSDATAGGLSLRPLAVELDTLERDLLAAYRPPVSLDRHGEFISASSLLNDARLLDRAGLRHGALLRYLQAVLLSARLRTKPTPLAPAELETRLRDFSQRLAARPGDGTIGALFLDAARGAAAGPDADPITAAIHLTEVLPRYFAALEPAPPAAPPPEAQVTVTLVRWPFT